MSSKKKIVTGAVALGTAAALTLGGTFAWQSISQRALNEKSNIVNPGGRLHDDFDGTNKDVYVENFASEDIFARIRLEEYFEIVMNYGVEGAEKTIPMIGSKTEKTDGNGDLVTTEDGKQLYDYTYVPFTNYSAGWSAEAGITGADTDEEYSWWHWDMGGDTVFMPTFNKNKDSLQADINGEYKFDTGVITSEDVEGGQYTEMATYEEGDTEDGQAIYDADSNTVDEVSSDFENLQTYVDANNIKLVTETHTAKATPSGSLMSMADWLAAVAEDGYVEGYDACWVYDTDGWVYWSAPIKAGEATGLLLDGIELNQVMDDTWYYAINVVAQFVTANDVGKGEGTGFYADGETVSEGAETLLKTIGVQFGEDDEDSNTAKKLTLGDATADENGSTRIVQYVAAQFDEAVTINSNSDSPLTLAAMYAITWDQSGKKELTEGTDYTVEGNVYTFISGGNIPTDGAMIEVMTEDDTKVGYICLDADDSVELRVMDAVSDAAVVTLNTPISLVYSGYAWNWAVAYYDWEDTYWSCVPGDENFTLEDETVTINNPEFVGKMIALNYINPSGKGTDCGVIYLIVLPADDTADDSTDGETQTTGLQFDTWVLEEGENAGTMEISGNQITYTPSSDKTGTAVIKPTLKTVDGENVTTGVTGWTVQIINPGLNVDDELGFRNSEDCGEAEGEIWIGRSPSTRDAAMVIYNTTTGEFTVQEKNVEWNGTLLNFSITQLYTLNGSSVTVNTTMTFSN